jgi:hypothetical protein
MFLQNLLGASDSCWPLTKSRTFSYFWIQLRDRFDGVLHFASRACEALPLFQNSRDHMLTVIFRADFSRGTHISLLGVCGRSRFQSLLTPLIDVTVRHASYS